MEGARLMVKVSIIQRSFLIDLVHWKMAGLVLFLTPRSPA